MRSPVKERQAKDFMRDVSNPFMPNELFYHNFGPVFNRRNVWLFVVLPCSKTIPALNANSVDPDQMPNSEVFDLALHCLPVSVLWILMQYFFMIFFMKVYVVGNLN